MYLKTMGMVVEIVSMFGTGGSPGQLRLPRYPKFYHLVILSREERGEFQI